MSIPTKTKQQSLLFGSNVARDSIENASDLAQRGTRRGIYLSMRVSNVTSSGLYKHLSYKVQNRSFFVT